MSLVIGALVGLALCAAYFIGVNSGYTDGWHDGVQEAYGWKLPSTDSVSEEKK